jgi:phosphoserine phosphatase
MQQESVERVIARMDEAMNGTARPVITTDADGTLWAGDVGEDAFEALLEERAVREVTREALAAEADRAGLATTGDANDLSERIYAAFKTGDFDEERCYMLMAWAFAGWTPDEVRSFASRNQERRGLAKRIHAEMQTVVRWAQKRGVEMWVVSASPRFVVQSAAARFGIPPERVVATSVAVRDGRLAPCLSAPLPYGSGKVAAIGRDVGPSRVIGAFGDDVYDLEMLLGADVPVAVRPKPRLRQRVESGSMLVELAPEAIARGVSVWPPAR